jgi:hypothetical protein
MYYPQSLHVRFALKANKLLMATVRPLSAKSGPRKHFGMSPEREKPQTLRDVEEPSVGSAGSRQLRDFPDVRDPGACSRRLGQWVQHCIIVIADWRQRPIHTAPRVGDRTRWKSSKPAAA